MRRFGLSGIMHGGAGSEVAEAALVLPLMFMILLGIFWFGQAFRIYGTITHAAREGARAAVAPVCSTCAASASTPAQRAYNAVQSALLAARVDPANLIANPKTAPNSLVSCADGKTTVNCDGGKTAPANVCVQENVQLSNTSSGGAGVCGTVVSLRYKYPYHFYLPCWPAPCKSLDLRKMTLPAEAEMRVETQ